MDALTEIYKRYKDVHHLETIQELLDWDQQVVMPAAGAKQRGEQMSAIARQVHQALADPVLGELIEEASALPDLPPLARTDLRLLRRRHERAARVPADLMARHARLAALTQGTWEIAFAEKRFALFRDALAEMVAATRELGQALDSSAPYDALIEEYEPGMSSTRISGLFTDLSRELLIILEDHRERRGPQPWEFGEASFPAKIQKRVAKEILTEMGLDFRSLRLDASTHPCTSGTGRDVRITTRYRLRNPTVGLLSAIHEWGHALYEQGLPGDRLATPSGGFCSFGIHESLSLFWENFIGRSRPFLNRLLARLSAAFPGALDALDPDRFFWTVNRVRRSPIRIEADELTYVLHIVIRFELERALMAGDLPVDDLPEAWNHLYAKKLGLRPRHDGEGVLQDIHWAAGLFGYFPSYALGYIYAAQLHETLHLERSGLDERISAGDLRIVTQWLKERVHEQARKVTSYELIRAATGELPSAEPLLRYWRKKYVSDL